MYTGALDVIILLLMTNVCWSNQSRLGTEPQTAIIMTTGVLHRKMCILVHSFTLNSIFDVNKASMHIYALRPNGTQ